MRLLFLHIYKIIVQRISSFHSRKFLNSVGVLYHNTGCQPGVCEPTIHLRHAPTKIEARHVHGAHRTALGCSVPLRAKPFEARSHFPVALLLFSSLPRVKTRVMMGNSYGVRESGGNGVPKKKQRLALFLHGHKIFLFAIAHMTAIAFGQFAKRCPCWNMRDLVAVFLVVDGQAVAALIDGVGMAIYRWSVG
ncbi:hypothetical protein SAMN04488109_1204 [Chryseolinea serpens]|uniref:Uncharacterized protein n=1 Tax=Chryseolinea serpens TaxID=947013 RepID=A0A1M5LIR1_9BACT|nr:hypothetical protein SAMN04488109_1204 [Chryseolinea serpens]